jgi:hypothetical protein
MARNTGTEQYPRLPVYRKTTLQGNENEISKSKIIDEIEIE